MQGAPGAVITPLTPDFDAPLGGAVPHENTLNARWPLTTIQPRRGVGLLDGPNPTATGENSASTHSARNTRVREGRHDHDLYRLRRENRAPHNIFAPTVSDQALCTEWKRASDERIQASPRVNCPEIGIQFYGTRNLGSDCLGNRYSREYPRTPRFRAETLQVAMRAEAPVRLILLI